MIIFLSILAVSLEETSVKTIWKADQESRQAATSIVPSKVSSHNGKTILGDPGITHSIPTAFICVGSAVAQW